MVMSNRIEGLVAQAGGEHELDLDWLYIIVIGFIGAYTTFSTFEYEIMRLMIDGRFGISLLYVGSSLLVGFFMVWVGAVAAELVI